MLGFGPFSSAAISDFFEEDSGPSSLILLDAAIQATLSKSIDLDAALQETVRKYIGLDAQLFATLLLVVDLDAAILDTLTKNSDLDGRLDYGRHVWMDCLITGTPQLSMLLDGRLDYGRQLWIDAMILSPTAGENQDRHRFTGDKEAGGDYGNTTWTEITYLRGLKPGE